jgi:hypothetical protein
MAGTGNLIREYWLACGGGSTGEEAVGEEAAAVCCAPAGAAARPARSGTISKA